MPITTLRSGQRRAGRPSAQVGTVDRIEIARLQYLTGKSQKGVADEADFVLGTYRNCLSGKVPMPTLETLAGALTTLLRERLNRDDLEGPEGSVIAADLLPVHIDGEVVSARRAELGYTKDRFLTLVNARVPDEVAKARVVPANDDSTILVGREALDELEAGERPVCLFHHQARAMAYVLAPTEKNPRFLYSGGRRGAYVSTEAVLTHIEEVALPALAKLILEQHVWKTDESETGGFLDSRPRDKGRIQAFSTAQCLTALLELREDGTNDVVIRECFDFLDRTELRDESPDGPKGGWGYYYVQKEPVTEVACWVTLAYAKSVRCGFWTHGELQERVRPRLRALVQEVLRHQTPKGGFSLTRLAVNAHLRTYTTIMAVWAMIEALRSDPDLANSLERPLVRAIGWLVESHTANGFLPDPDHLPDGPFLPGLHAQAMYVLSLLETMPVRGEKIPSICLRPLATQGYTNAKELFLSWARHKLPPCWSKENDSIPDKATHFLEPDIGFRSEAGRNLWGPWTLAALHNLSQIDGSDVAPLRNQVAAKFYDFHRSEASAALGVLGMYELAEAAYCLSHLIEG